MRFLRNSFNKELFNKATNIRKKNRGEKIMQLFFLLNSKQMLPDFFAANCFLRFSILYCFFKGSKLITKTFQVNQFFKRSVEKRLNDAFSRLGREINDLSFTLKRRLPRRESERK